MSDLASASALVLPAWIEHQPRLALLALASGIPVIATEACGLPPHEKLHVIAAPDPAALAAAIRSVLHPTLSTLPIDLQMAQFSPEQLKAAGFNATGSHPIPIQTVSTRAPDGDLRKSN